VLRERPQLPNRVPNPKTLSHPLDGLCWLKFRHYTQGVGPRGLRHVLQNVNEGEIGHYYQGIRAQFKNRDLCPGLFVGPRRGLILLVEVSGRQTLSEQSDMSIHHLVRV